MPANRRVLTAVTVPLWVQIPESLPTKVCPAKSAVNTESSLLELCLAVTTLCRLFCLSTLPYLFLCPDCPGFCLLFLLYHTQHTHPCSGEIRTRNFSKRGSTGSLLWQRGHWDRQNRTRDLPSCGAVPQPTAPLCHKHSRCRNIKRGSPSLDAILRHSAGDAKDGKVLVSTTGSSAKVGNGRLPNTNLGSEKICGKNCHFATLQLSSASSTSLSLIY